MAGVVHWIDGQAHREDNVEKICPSIHITQNQWKEDWNLDYFGEDTHYSYISDYECVFKHPVNANFIKQIHGTQQWQDLQEAKQQGTNVHLTDLAHFTKPEKAQDIIDEEGFRGGKKKINQNNGDDINALLSWWGPNFTERARNHVRKTLGTAIKPFFSPYNDKDVLDQFALSPAFKPESWRYGGSYFLYSIDELCQYYENYREGGEIQFKILGTYLYKQEIMHAVLVCSDADEQFEDYPDIPAPDDGNNEAILTRDEDGNWVWRPQATATKIARLSSHLQNFPNYRRWEHVAFAFYTPDGQVFNLPDLQDHRHEL